MRLRLRRCYGLAGCAALRSIGRCSAGRAGPIRFPMIPTTPRSGSTRQIPSRSLIIGTNKVKAPPARWLCSGWMARRARRSRSRSAEQRRCRVRIEHSGGKAIDIAVATERLKDQLRVFRIATGRQWDHRRDVAGKHARVCRPARASKRRRWASRFTAVRAMARSLRLSLRRTARAKDILRSTGWKTMAQGE